MAESNKHSLLNCQEHNTATPSKTRWLRLLKVFILLSVLIKFCVQHFPNFIEIKVVLFVLFPLFEHARK